MFTTLLFAVPMAVVWMVVTASLTLDSFLVGLILAIAILLMIRRENIQVERGKLLDQLAAFVVYTVTLLRDIWLSSVDVARRVLSPQMPLNPGIIAVQTQDDSDFIAAFSAHGITITPGELVVDFDGNHTMYVHCLDVNNSTQNAAAAQEKRLKLLRRIMGKG